MENESGFSISSYKSLSSLSYHVLVIMGQLPGLCLHCSVHSGKKL